MANELFPDIDSKDLNRIFDHKVAQDHDSQYDGEKSGENWMRKVRGYLVSQCSGIAPLLDFAESLDDEPITFERLQAESSSYRWMTELNVAKLGDKLWGWLNTALLDKATTPRPQTSSMGSTAGGASCSRSTRAPRPARAF